MLVSNFFFFIFIQIGLGPYCKKTMNVIVTLYTRQALYNLNFIQEVFFETLVLLIL